MKPKALAIFFLVIMMAFLGAVAASGQSETNERLLKYYDLRIMDQIAKCHSKAALKASKSENLRSCAVVSSKKAVFLITHKDMLIQEMVKNEIGTKPYKIDYFLNQQFHQLKR